jgi:redox-sensitive bicupin YhaK (pirin superfamily)
MSIRNPPTPYTGSDVVLGQLSVLRALPVRTRRMVGPWCFLDRFGPLSFTDGMPMDIAPHPHIGLQTVSWLLAGEIAHADRSHGQTQRHSAVDGASRRATRRPSRLPAPVRGAAV